MSKGFAIAAIVTLVSFKLPCFAAEELLPPPAERGPFSVLVGEKPNLLQETCPEELRETGMRLLAQVHRTRDYSKARLWLDQVQDILRRCRPYGAKAKRQREEMINAVFVPLVDSLERNLRSACPTSVAEEWLPVLDRFRETATTNSWSSTRSEIEPVIEGCHELNSLEQDLRSACPTSVVEEWLPILEQFREPATTNSSSSTRSEIELVIEGCRELNRKRAARELAAETEKRRKEADRRAEEQKRRAEKQRRERVQELERATARLAEIEAEREELVAKLAEELERQARLKAYCDNGHLYFTKTWFGFGDWVEIDESTGVTVPINEFDLNNAVRNRLLELEAAGWKDKIPAKTVACGPGVQAIHDVLR